MGASVSSNKVEEKLNECVTIINDTAQTCRTETSETQNIVVNNSCGPNGGVNISHVNFNINGTYSIKCGQKAVNQNKVNQQVDAVMKQLSNSLTGTLGVGYASANNVAQLTANVATSIKNDTLQNCIASVAMEQGIYVIQDGVCPNSKDVDITYINMSENSTSMSKCMQDAVNGNDAVQQLKATVAQKATATVEGLLGPFMLILLIILLVVGGSAMGGVKLLTSPAFIALLVVVILIYLLIAWLRNPKWFPFDA
jgi:hypothetical protein